MATMVEPQLQTLDRNQDPARPRLLLVDDNAMVRVTLSKILEGGGFQVETAGNVNEALKLIGTRSFDALLSDLHMPGAGDGLTVVSAMRHFNPQAVTIIFSGYPEMKEAAAAILLQADEILVKPMSPPGPHPDHQRQTQSRRKPENPSHPDSRLHP